MRKLIYGVGFNSGGKHKTTEKEKHTKAYSSWKSILRRCYCPIALSKNPTYLGCVVSDEWHDFQVFAEWWHSNEFSAMGYQLDKDLLSLNSKTYSPETCCLIPQSVNKLFNGYNAARGEHPIGVSFKKSIGKYVASMSVNSKVTHLGCFSTASQAHQAYVVAKEAYVKEVANEWRGRIDERAYEALMRWTVKK